MQKKIVLPKPMGFCAGVDRAIKGVVVLTVSEKLCLIKGPIYQNHAAVHNEEVVRQLTKLGAPVQEDIMKVPKDSIYVFSAHGVPPSMRDEAVRKKLRVVDLTCQLVSRVHNAVLRESLADHVTLYLCKTPNHPEAAGVIGENPEKIIPITGPEDVEKLSFPKGTKLFFTTQTTLSVTDVMASMTAIHDKFPGIKELNATCYATTNRQNAVVDSIQNVNPDLMIVVGSKTSSNTKSLVKRGQEHGITSYLVGDRGDMKGEWLNDVKTVLVTSGASTPDYLVSGVLSFLKHNGIGDVDYHVVKDEGNIIFKLPQDIKDLESKIRDEISGIEKANYSKHAALLLSLAANPFFRQYLLDGKSSFTPALRM